MEEREEEEENSLAGRRVVFVLLRVCVVLRPETHLEKCTHSCQCQGHPKACQLGTVLSGQPQLVGEFHKQLLPHWPERCKGHVMVPGALHPPEGMPIQHPLGASCSCPGKSRFAPVGPLVTQVSRAPPAPALLPSPSTHTPQAIIHFPPPLAEPQRHP